MTCSLPTLQLGMRQAISPKSPSMFLTKFLLDGSFRNDKVLEETYLEGLPEISFMLRTSYNKSSFPRSIVEYRPIMSPKYHFPHQVCHFFDSCMHTACKDIRIGAALNVPGCSRLGHVDKLPGIDISQRAEITELLVCTISDCSNSSDCTAVVDEIFSNSEQSKGSFLVPEWQSRLEVASGWCVRWLSWWYLSLSGSGAFQPVL